MKRMISVSCAVLALSVALASVPAFAQGPSGLNFSGGGPNQFPWSGAANGQVNPPTAPTRPLIPLLPGGPQPGQPYH